MHLRILGHGSQSLAEEDVDQDRGVDGPAVGIEDRSEVALAELAPCDEAGGAGDDKHQYGYQDQPLPPDQALEGVDNDGQDAGNGGYGHCHHGCDTSELGDIERGGLGGGIYSICRFVGRVVRNVGQCTHSLGILVGGRLVDLVGDELAELAVRAPEGLADADGIVDDLGDDGIPVLTVTVIEHTVLARTEVADAAGSHQGYDVHRTGLYLGCTGTVKEEHAAECGHIGMLAHISDADTELAATLVNIEFTCIEHCELLRIAGIEIAEDHVVVQKLGEMRIVTNELADLIDTVGFLLLGLVGIEEGEEGRLAVGREQGLDLVKAERLDLGAGLGGLPGVVRSEAGHDLVPLGLGHALLVRERGNKGLDRIDGRLPGGVDAREREYLVIGRAGYRIFCDLGLLVGEIAAGDGDDLLDVDIHCGGGCIVEGDELAAHKEVLDLGVDGLDGGVNRLGVGAVRHGLGPGRLPGGVRLGRLEELLDQLGGDAGLAAAVLDRADRLDDLSDDFLDIFVIGRNGGDDSVAVELGTGKYLGGVLDVFEGDLFLVQAEILQDTLGRIVKLLSRFVTRVDQGKRKGLAAFENGIAVLDDRRQPFGGGNNFRDTDLPVGIRIQ